MISLLETTVPVVKEIVKVPIMDFIQANGLVALAVGFCLVVSIVFLFKKKKRY